MSVILFISEQAFKEATVFNENIDDKLISPIIREAQEIHIHQTIGTGLYNEIRSQIDADTLSADNKTLLDDYIQPSLIQWIKYEASPEMLFKFMNKSTVKKRSENSDSIDIEELKYLRALIRDKAEWYTKRIVLFLCENSVTYPLYLNPGTGADVLHPKKDSYYSGLYLGMENTRTKPQTFEDKYQGEF